MLPASLLQKTSILVASQLGLDFPANRWDDLERAIRLAAHELRIRETVEGISDWLSGDSLKRSELELLATFLTVGETYFFREKTGLDLFQNQIIPEIIKERRGKDQYLRIWSAGCCTGEEPYTLAILLREMIPDIENWRVTILATDINRKFLAKAQSGIYSQWSFRETSQPIKNKYFRPIGKNWEIIPEIKQMITFSVLNLADDLYPSTLSNTHNMDAVFCRNVLMYFTPGQIRLTAQRFRQSLVDQGWLITSAVELNDDYFSAFTSFNLESGIFYRKTTLASIPLAPSPARKPTGQHPLSEKLIQVRKAKPAIPVVTKNTAGTHSPKFHKEVQSPYHEIQTLFSTGKYQQCADRCFRLLENKPADVGALTFVVKSYANMGHLADARKWGEQLLVQGGIDAEAYYLVATIKMEENDQVGCESILKRALYLDPHHILSHFLMGNIAQKSGRTRVAAKHFQNVRELLATFRDNEIVKGSEGLTAGRMAEMVTRLMVPID